MRFLEVIIHYKCSCGHYNSTADRVAMDKWICPACGKINEETVPLQSDFRLIPTDQINSYVAELFECFLAARRKKIGEK